MIKLASIKPAFPEKVSNDRFGRERILVKMSIAGAMLACLLLSLCASAQPASLSARAGGMRSAGNFHSFPRGPFVQSFLCGGNNSGVRGGLGFGTLGSVGRGFGGSGLGGLGSGGLCGGFGLGGFGAVGWSGGVLPSGFSDIFRPDQGEPVHAAEPQEAPPPSPFFGAPLMPPSPPARSVIREYNWPASTSHAASTISLVLKDGTVRLAIAVWTEDGVVHYTGRDGTVGRLPLDSINREATTRTNAEGQVTLWLPASKEVR